MQSRTTPVGSGESDPNGRYIHHSAVQNSQTIYLDCGTIIDEAGGFGRHTNVPASIRFWKPDFVHPVRGAKVTVHGEAKSPTHIAMADLLEHSLTKSLVPRWYGYR